MTSRFFAAALVWAPLVLGACGGGGEPAAGSSTEDVAGAAADRLAQTWVVQLADQESMSRYGNQRAWVDLLSTRNAKSAVATLGRKGDLAALRAHSEAAFIYRQAALLGANSLIQTYGITPEETDPVGTAHLLTVSYAITGDLEKARAASKKLGDAEDPTQAWHGPWRTWLAGSAEWPPDLSGLPLELPEPTAGEWPQLGVLPHYELPELGSDSKRAMADPGALLALALWHDAVAKEASGQNYPIEMAVRAGYQLPLEPKPGPAGEVPMDLLFGSDLLVSADADFLAAVHGSEGAGAVDAYADKSLLAWLAKESRVEGKLDPELAVDLVAKLRSDLLDASSAKTNGEVQDYHTKFTDVAMVGAFRSLALVAEIEGDREASGLLRINALDKSQKHTADPVGMLALGAWDASNRYPTRAQDILHAQAKRFPSLEVARYGLDVMALRVSRERPGETPGM